MSNPKWLRDFGLSGSPFSKDLDDTDLWLPESRIEVVDTSPESLENHEHAALVGESGVGKTCTLRALRNRLPDSEFRLTYCHNATLGRRDFYRQLCLALQLPVKATAAGVFWALTNNVQELSRERIHPVFILDEAQRLRDDVLQHLHILSNYSWDQKPLLSLVLVGLPDLWRRLSLGIHRSLWSRIHCRVSLTLAQPEDTAEYMAHRLGQVGGRQSLFGSEALTILHEATSGQLRDIDRLATACLRSASRRGLKKIDRGVVQDAIEADVSLT